jgi:hypothetical protein
LVDDALAALPGKACCDDEIWDAGAPAEDPNGLAGMYRGGKLRRQMRWYVDFVSIRQNHTLNVADRCHSKHLDRPLEIDPLS